MQWGTQYALYMYAVGVSAKRSTHTVDLANMLANTEDCVLHTAFWCLRLLRETLGSNYGQNSIGKNYKSKENQ